MAIADTITSMQTHTSNAYTMIGYGTDLTGINKNLENLSSTIFNAFLEALRTPDTLFTNLPKKSGSGANITLNDTANAPMRIMPNASELTQDGTPTPSSPQDIHTISGSNTIKVEGKNVVDTTKSTTGKEIFSGGTILTNSNANLTDYIYIGNFTSTVISFTSSKTSFSWNTCYFDENKNVVSGGQNGYGLTTVGTTGIIKSNPTGAKYIRFSYPNDSTDVMLEGGTSKSTYTPYVSQEADIDLKSRNLFNINELRIKTDYILNDSGTEISDVSGGYTKMYIPVQPNTQYTISGVSESGTKRIYYFNSSKTFISRSDGFGPSYKTFTTPNNCYYVDFQYYTNGNNFNTYQLELGSTPTNYVPYYDYGFYGKIGNYEDKFIRTSGKNLFDEALLSQQASYNTYSNGVWTTNNSSNWFLSILYNIAGTTTRDVSKLIPLKAGTYTIKIDNFTNNTGHASPLTYKTFDSTGTQISSESTSQTTYTITASVDCYLDICRTNSTGTLSFSTIMINKGTTALPYEPYGSNEWYIKKNIGKVVLDTLNWTYIADGNRFIFNDTSSLNIKGATSDGTPVDTIMCNIYEILSNNTLAGNSYNYGIALTTGSLLRAKYTDTTDVNTFKTMLTNTNAIMYYVLANPTYTQITGTLAEQLEYVYKNMLSQEGQTNISQVNNDLAFEISVSALEEL